MTADQEEDEKRETTVREAEEVIHAAKKLALDKDVATEATQRVNQLFVLLVPTVSCKDALISLVKAQPVRAGPNSSMMAFWYTKGDREQAVYPGQNRYAREASLSEVNFASWLGVVENLVKPGDVVVICEENEWGSKQILPNKLAATRWTVRPLILQYDSDGWRSLWASGTFRHADGKRATPRAPRGFAKLGAAETM